MSVRLDFQRFDSIPGQYALIDVKWRLRSLSAGGKALASCRSSIQTRAGATIDDIVIAHQHNLQRLSADIIQMIGNEAGPCP
ncbi:ABC-type transport auxiliary lipoprotein family protein [Pseudomonas sp.]|uniref:ABC-type transport auxiliary lipoprotein family protein n=1 Tax=Pseudomonas sp. TaxID=306 RepID=UPI003D114B74